MYIRSFNTFLLECLSLSNNKSMDIKAAFVCFLIGPLMIKTAAQKEMLFLEDLSTLCPYTTFCNSSEEQFQIPETHKPCCRSCSCEEDCGLKHNCCTYNMDKYRLDERNVTSCIAASVYRGQVAPPGVAWYHMHDTCPGGEPCRTDGEHTSDGLFPCSSLKDGSIYFNSNCGECNNATDLLPWRVGFVCRQQSSLGLIADISSSVDNLLKGWTADNECLIRFIPPDEVKITTEECYPESRIIRDCEPYDPDIVVSEKIRAKCKLFNATYQPLGTLYESVYANVYCAKCSKIPTNNVICEDNSSVNKAPAGSLFLLLDNEDDSKMLLKPEKMESCNAVKIVFCFRNSICY